MTYRTGSPPIYTGCGESSKGVDPSEIHRMGCTPVYRVCGQSLKSVDPSMIHSMGSTPIHKGCGESLRGVDPSMIHRMGCTSIYKDAVIPYSLLTNLHTTTGHGIMVSRAVVNPGALHTISISPRLMCTLLPGLQFSLHLVDHDAYHHNLCTHGFTDYRDS